MRVRPMAAGILIGLCGVVALAQQQGPMIREKAPTDRAVDFSRQDILDAFKEMDSKKLATLRLLEGGTYNVNIRRLRGSETALIHPVTTDVWVVREGSGTLVTGGTLVDKEGNPAKGNAGAAIKGGVERRIQEGDVVFIPAGLPHGIKESESITWLNIRFDTK